MCLCPTLDGFFFQLFNTEMLADLKILWGHLEVTGSVRSLTPNNKLGETWTTWSCCVSREEAWGTKSSDLLPLSHGYTPWDAEELHQVPEALSCLERGWALRDALRYVLNFLMRSHVFRGREDRWLYVSSSSIQMSLEIFLRLSELSHFIAFSLEKIHA